jgi:DNA helicase-2/ATP-dependent DNA helicase PcrA
MMLEYSIMNKSDNFQFINPAENLNPEQKRAVQTIEGPLLIIAGAGSGKTKVITHRILNLIKNGVAPHAILAITFTNKAANEMKDRIHALLSEDKALNRPISMQERPFVSTFHALGVHIIRENARLLGLTRHFTIFDRGDSRRAIKEAMAECSIDPKMHDPGTILNAISRAKGDGISRLDYFDSAKGYREEIIANVWEKYENILAKEKSLDFDDLLVKTSELLEKNADIRKHYGGIWKYVHIDEYQDTNKIQYKIAKSIIEGQLESENATNSGKNSENDGPRVANICVVGDVDQNIYSWRGATIENILNFEKDYPNATVITLEKNYRSTKTILAAANSVIEKNTMRRDKNLYTDNAEGEKISLIVSYNEIEEARAIVDKARELIEKGTSPREIAVLYRANFQSRVLEEFFIKKQIPYQLLGVKFFERKEVKDVISYIRAALNRDSWGDIARIINVPARGIGKVTLAKIVAKDMTAIPLGTRTKIESFYKLLDDMKDEIAEKRPSEAVKFALQESGIEKMYREGVGDDEERLMNVRELVSVAAQYDTLAGGAGMEAFLENVALATDQDELQKDNDAVKMMTVHAAKGLEFEYVFITGLEQDLFPFKHMDDAGIDPAEGEEERRLFYVALTRAKKKLFLSNAIIRTVYGSQRVSAPSEFIADIEKELIEETAPEKPSGAKAIFIDF